MREGEQMNTEGSLFDVLRSVEYEQKNREEYIEITIDHVRLNVYNHHRWI